jgi:hypothetical protein
MMANFESFKNFSSALAALAVPLVVAVVGSYYSKAAKEREVSGKFVELAVQPVATIVVELIEQP